MFQCILQIPLCINKDFSSNSFKILGLLFAKCPLQNYQSARIKEQEIYAA